MNSYQSLVESVLLPVSSSGDDKIYLCPKCSDTSGHLYVNYDKNKFHCFRCNYGGKSIIKLLKDLNVQLDFDYEDLDQDQEIRSTRLDSIINNEENEVKYVDYSVNLKTLTEFYYRSTKDLTIPAINYLHSRYITDDMIEFYNIREGIDLSNQVLSINGISYKGINYKNRVFVPSITKDGQVSYYVARDYLGLSARKYLNPPKELSYASEDIWCLDKISGDLIIICEGVFTALSINSRLGKHVAIATYGKDIATKSNSDMLIRGTSQLTKLLNRKFKSYVLFYDKDAIEEMYNCAKELVDRGCSVSCVTIDTNKYGKHADAADLTTEELYYYLRNAKPYSNLDKAFIGLSLE